MIEELARQIRARGRFTAVGIALSHRDNPIELAVSGFRQHKCQIPVEVEDKWHIGSITKSLTSTLIAELVEAGAFSFESTIPDLLPDIPMRPSWSQCTLEHLLTHTSGLPANFPWKAQEIDPPTSTELMTARNKLIRETLCKSSKSPAGSAFLYSNLGYAIAGHIAETKMKTCYEELIRDRLLTPIGLESAGFGPPVGEGPDDEPMGHFTVLGFRKPANPFKGRADNGPVMSAAGRAHMNLRDLLAYGRLHLDGELGTADFLKTETWRRLHHASENDYAYGWANKEQDWAGGPVIWHDGSNRMWYALLMLVPHKNIVLAFVTNNGAIKKAEKAFTLAAEQIGRQLS